MSFYKAQKALSEIRVKLVGQANKDPINWDMALALEEIAKELDHRLTGIETAIDRITGLVQKR